MRPLKEADIARFRGYSDEETDPIFQPGELVMVVGLHTRDPDVLHCIRAVDRARYEANDPSLCGDEIRRSELDLLPYDPLPADDPTRWYVIDNVKTINDQRDLIGRLWSGLELIAGGYANAAEAQAIARHVMKPIAGSGGGPQTSEVPVKRVFKIKPRPKSGQKQRMD